MRNPMAKRFLMGGVHKAGGSMESFTSKTKEKNALEPLLMLSRLDKTCIGWASISENDSGTSFRPL